MQLIDKIINGIYDWEYLLIMGLLFVLFLLGLKKKETKTENYRFDLNYSIALKGIACVIILLGHFQGIGCVKHTSAISLFASMSTNVALVWFMFTSGYGLSLSSKEGFSVVYSRCTKVFTPMLFVFLLSLVIYMFIPVSFSAQEAKEMAIPAEIFNLHKFKWEDLTFILKGAIRWYWYVWCILIFYILFYLARAISKKLLVINHTWILFVLLFSWYVFAYFVLGQSLAHYYRLTWAFFFGHLFAVRNLINIRHLIILVSLSILSFIPEGILMTLMFILSIMGIAICVWLDKSYSFESKLLLSLGKVSYFYYLVHRRICWVVCCAILGITDLACWAALTLVISMLLYLIYHKQLHVGFSNK